MEFSPMPLHTPSKFRWHPRPRQSIPWQGFLALEDTKTKVYPYLKTIISLPQNHHIDHSMLMEINGHNWVPVSHNGPPPESFTNILLPIPIPFVIAANACC